MEKLDHRSFKTVVQIVETQGQNIYLQARNDVQHSLNNLYGDQDISVQQLSATFRRGDLIERLNH